MTPLSQRTEDDCSICALAMVMSPPYTYERVLSDSKKYVWRDDEGNFLPWWKNYLIDEGFEVAHSALSDLKSFSDFESLPGDTRALLVFQIPHQGIGHIVAIDRHGIIDPMNDPAYYQGIQDFSEIFRIEGWRLYSANYWAVRRR
jgi:hypothetical protein